MNKQVMTKSMYNEYESTTFEAIEDFDNIEKHIKECVKTMSEKYKVNDIELYLLGLVSMECSEKRLLTAMAMKHRIREEKKARLKNERIQNKAQA